MTVPIILAPWQASLLQPSTTYRFHYLVKRCLNFCIYCDMVSFAMKLLVQIIFPLDCFIFPTLLHLPFFAALMQDAVFEGLVLTVLPFRLHLNAPLQTFRAANVDMFESAISRPHHGCKCKHKVNECEHFNISAPYKWKSPPPTRSSKIFFIFYLFFTPVIHIHETGHKMSGGNGPSSLNLSKLVSDGIFQYIYCTFIYCALTLINIRFNKQ